MKKILFLIITILLISALLTLGFSANPLLEISKLENKVAKKPTPKVLTQLIQLLEKQGFYYEEIFHLNTLAKLDAKNAKTYDAQINVIKRKILKKELMDYRKTLKAELDKYTAAIQDLNDEIKDFEIRKDKLEQKLAKVKDPKIRRDLSFQIGDSDFEIKRKRSTIKKYSSKVDELKGLINFVDNLIDSL